jgi:capsid assembly protease
MYEHIAEAVYGVPLAILPEKLAVIQAFLSRRLAGERLPEDEVQAAMQAALPRGPRPQSGAVAVIPIYGVISQRAGMLTQASGGTSIDALTRDFRAALAEPGVRAIVFDIASPGGSTYGVQELAAEIYAARGRKPIAAVANAVAASAAYWLGSAAGDFAVTPSGEVGSIGVYAIHQDDSRAMQAAGIDQTVISAGRYKAEGIGPLSDETRQYIQEKVDAAHQQFLADVARGRGVTSAEVRQRYGEGRMLDAKAAKAAGMVDRIATLDEVVARLGGSTAGSMRAEVDGIGLVAALAEAEPGALDGAPVPSATEPADVARLREHYRLALA